MASYLHYLTLAFIGAMILTNLALATCLLKTDGSKHLWTACAGVLLPNAFISRDTVEVRNIFGNLNKISMNCYVWPNDSLPILNVNVHLSLLHSYF